MLNELLITQTQPTPAVSPKETGLAEKGTATPDNSFEKLVNDAVKKQAEKSQTKKPAADDRIPRQEESVQGMAAAPGVPGEIFAPQPVKDSNAVLVQEIAVNELRIAQSAEAQRGTEAVVGVPIPSTRRLDEKVEPMEKVISNPKPIDAEAKTAAETDFQADDGFSEQTKAQLELPQTVVSKDDSVINLPDERKMLDELPQTVLLSDIAVNTLENETAAVKVGENYDVDLTKPNFAEQLTDTILVRSNGETTEFELSLYPKELGKIKVNVVFENGRAMVSLICENQKAEQILSAHTDDIRAIVDGNSKAQTQVNVRQEGDAGNQGDNLDGRNQERERQEQQNRKPKQEEVRFFIDQLKMDMLTSA